jgi:large subunit ribosomal protein L2
MTKINTRNLKKGKSLSKTSGKPYKALTSILKKHSGRNSSGRVSVRHQGGRQKRYYREIDFKRDKRDMKGTILTIEYDPNRTCDIALVEYTDKTKRYILCPINLAVGSKIEAGENVDVVVGNALPLKNIPLGTEIHNIEMYKGKGGQIIRSAGSYAVVIAKEGNYADIKLPSKEVRKISLDCYATIGQLANADHKLEEIGSAGRKRHMGIRPTVRGTAQNPRSHPHGGGEGRSGEGMAPKTPWGKSARGTKTRRPNKWSNKFIVKKKG